jgi:hypothetical protein
MSILSGFVLWVTHFAIDILSATGYAGVFVLMALESMVTPIPSEAVMPFAGFLVGRGTLSLAGVWAASVLGSLTGSLLLYWIGARFGERAVAVAVAVLLLLALLQQVVFQSSHWSLHQGPHLLLTPVLEMSALLGVPNFRVFNFRLITNEMISINFWISSMEILISNNSWVGWNLPDASWAIKNH